MSRHGPWQGLQELSPVVCSYVTNHTKLCGCLKLVIQFDHESAGLWVGLSETGWLFNATSVGVAC